VRVLFIGEREIIAEGLRAMLASHRDRAELVGHVLPTEDLRGVATRLGADVVLLESPLQLVSRLDGDGEKRPFRVVLFTDDANEWRLVEALRLGASGYLLRSLNGDQLADQLVRVRNGEVAVDPTMATRIALRGAHRENGRVWPGSQLGLSQRESQVLGLLADGLSNRLIASELVLGEETIKTHLRNIYKKLGVRDRAQAVAVAIRQGIVN
jgi:DNA-binding NarL/FixJ family response regulator